MDPVRSTTRSLRIPARFNGPPTSGNGGWVGGALARELPGPAVRVRLQRPPPLETELRIEPDDGGVVLMDGETPVARAWPATLELAAPPAVAFDDAVEAARGFRGFTDHAFPGCFVCGPERGEGDGLRLFPGPVPGRTEPGLVAAPWIPDASLVETGLAGDDPSGDAIAPAFVWAALDCPGCFSFPQPEGAFLLLGELTVRIDRPIAPGDRCVVVGWLLGEEGRKHTTGTAVYDGTGRCCGVGRAVWIEVARD